MTKDILDALQALAEKATPGPWIAGEPFPGKPRFMVADCGPVGKVYPCDQKPSHGTTSMDDANFIAAANPQTILSLIARIRELEGDTGKSAEADKNGPWNSGNEFLPFHPRASHVSPAYRDGWNHCYQAAISAGRAAPEGWKP